MQNNGSAVRLTGLLLLLAFSCCLCSLLSVWWRKHIKTLVDL